MKERLAPLRAHYAAGHTRSLDARRKALAALRRSIVAHTDELFEALHTDLGKSDRESYMSEVGVALAEIDHLSRHLRRLMRPRRVRGSLTIFPARCRVVAEPLGLVLIISPWNYPVNLTFAPLAGAVAAGNCVVIKPSQTSTATRAVMERIVAEAFDPSHVAMMCLDHEQTDRLLDEKFDHILFTGSARIGRQVMAKAARHLTPVTLELGGKSPCIIAADADLRVAARRVAWGKTFNAGQTCIAPDHIWVERSVADKFVGYLAEALDNIYGMPAMESAQYPHIITRRALDRLVGYTDGSSGRVVYGGSVDNERLALAPTVLRDVPLDSPVMQDEIFGPVIPVLEYDKIEDVIEYVNNNPKPLALYYFGCKSDGREVIARTSSGGACINDVVMHFAALNAPFGGVGESGMGKYHGEDSFLTFSNRRAVLVSGRHIDLPLRYPPFPPLGLLKKFM